MTKRDLAEDLRRAQPLVELPGMRAQVAESPMVWHAMLLPVALTAEPKFVLTGHINCHDCALCNVAGDLRDGGSLVPWRATYPDCTSTEEECAAYHGYEDAFDGLVPVPMTVLEGLFAAYYDGPDGKTHPTGWVLPRALIDRLDEWAQGLTEVAASCLSKADVWVGYLYEAKGAPLPDELMVVHAEPS